MTIQDLTWQQVEAALGNQGGIAVVGGKVIIDPSLITGDTFDGMGDSGVVEFMHKLHQACSAAQSTVNNGQPVGSRLSAFPPSTGTSPSNGFVTVTQQIITRVPLNLNQIIGTNN